MPSEVQAKIDELQKLLDESAGALTPEARAQLEGELAELKQAGPQTLAAYLEYLDGLRAGSPEDRERISSDPLPQYKEALWAAYHGLWQARYRLTRSNNCRLPEAPSPVDERAERFYRELSFSTEAGAISVARRGAERALSALSRLKVYLSALAANLGPMSKIIEKTSGTGKLIRLSVSWAELRQKCRDENGLEDPFVLDWRRCWRKEPYGFDHSFGEVVSGLLVSAAQFWLEANAFKYSHWPQAVETAKPVLIARRTGGPVRLGGRNHGCAVAAVHDKLKEVEGAITIVLPLTNLLLVIDWTLPKALLVTLEHEISCRIGDLLAEARGESHEEPGHEGGLGLLGMPDIREAIPPLLDYPRVEGLPPRATDAFAKLRGKPWRLKERDVAVAYAARRVGRVIEDLQRLRALLDGVERKEWMAEVEWETGQAEAHLAEELKRREARVTPRLQRPPALLAPTRFKQRFLSAPVEPNERKTALFEARDGALTLVTVLAGLHRDLEHPCSATQGFSHAWHLANALSQAGPAIARVDDELAAVHPMYPIVLNCYAHSWSAAVGEHALAVYYVLTHPNGNPEGATDLPVGLSGSLPAAPHGELERVWDSLCEVLTLLFPWDESDADNLRRGIEAEIQAAAQALVPSGGPTRLSGELPLAPARHSDDFRSVHWYGTDHRFTATQAACVRVLWRAWENGTPEIGQSTVLEHPEVEAESKRLVDVFKGHPAWNTMIVKGVTAGAYRLAEPTREP